MAGRWWGVVTSTHAPSSRYASYRRAARSSTAISFTLASLPPLQRRQRLFPGVQSYRLVYSEGDLLPGLIVDRYQDHLVLQTLTLGMELRTEAICEALERLMQPHAIIARNDVGIRALEGLPHEKKVLRGSLETPVEVWEGDIRFRVDPWEGQKTGFYLDQRENRCTLQPLLAGERVLDAFCYTGAWALHAARAGAREVVGR